MKDMTLGHVLLRAAESFPDDEALVFGSRRQSFVELAERVSHIAALLQQSDSAIVPILDVNSDIYFEYFLAASWAGRTACPLNWRWNVREIVAALHECDAELLLVGYGFGALAEAIRCEIGRPLSIVVIGDGPVPAGMTSIDQALSALAPIPPARRTGDDLAGVYYTGGTTGEAKGVMLSEGGIVMSAVAMLVAGEVDGAGRYLRCTPMFHYGDSAWAIATLMRGGTNIVQERFDASGWFAALAAERITASSLVPSMLATACSHDCGEGGTLRHIVYGGSPISPALLASAQRRFPDVGFSQGYGMTEYSSNMTILSPADHGDERRLASAGRANFATRLRVVEPLSGIPATLGEPGEVEVRGPQMMVGYLKRPAQTAEAMRDGWLRTGDVGYLDDRGYLYLVDRLKDMIVTGGENVYSAEVERVLSTHPAVRDVAVFGIPHPIWGEAVHAVVVRRVDGRTDALELREYCASFIARFKCPASVEFVEDMPLTAFGKIFKQALRDSYWTGDRAIG